MPAECANPRPRRHSSTGSLTTTKNVPSRKLVTTSQRAMTTSTTSTGVTERPAVLERKTFGKIDENQRIKIRGGFARIKSLRELRQVFDSLDLDDSGAVCAAEFQDKYREVGTYYNPAKKFEPKGSTHPTESQYVDICQSFLRVLGASRRRAGSFKFTDMLKVMYPYASNAELEKMDKSSKGQRELTAKQVAEVKAAFNAADHDGDGLVSVAEFQDTLKETYNHKEIRLMFVSFDGDRSKELDCDEYCRWYARQLGVQHYRHKQGLLLNEA